MEFYDEVAPFTHDDFDAVMALVRGPLPQEAVTEPHEPPGGTELRPDFRRALRSALWVDPCNG